MADLRRIHRPALAAVAVFVASFGAAPVRAEDPPKPAAPPAGPSDGAAPAKPEGEAAAAPKRERKVDARAADALRRYAKLLLLPSSGGAKSLAAQGEMRLEMIPEPIALSPKWTEADGFSLGVAIPDSVKQAYGPEVVEAIRKQFESLVTMMVEPLFADPSKQAEAYDLTAKDEADGVSVVFLPFDDSKARAERQRWVFGADGLLTRVVLTPKVDPKDPSAAMMAGIDVEMSIEHEKRGERYVTKGFTASLPMGEMRSTAEFWDGPGGLPLPKWIDVTLPMSSEPFRAELWNYTLDGKPAEWTARATPTSDPGAPAAPRTGTPPTPETPTPEPPKSDGSGAPTAPAK